MYKVIKAFKDLQDQGHKYQEGDIYPRDGKKISPERVKELASKNNNAGCPLIAEIAEPKEEAEVEKPKKTAKKKGK